MKPLVSLIIPIYNTEAYLHRCLDSIVRQTHRNLEIILIDDGSTDGSLDLSHSFAGMDARVRVLHQTNTGQGAARNAGLDVCTGDYVMFVDSDDYVEPNMVERLVQVASRDHLDLVMCGYRIVGGLRQQVRTFGDQPVLHNRETLMREYFYGQSVNGMPVAKLYARHLFDHIRFPRIRFREDSYIMHEVIDRALSSAFIPEPLYVYCTRSGSTEQSHLDTERVRSVLDATERLLLYTEQHHPNLLRYAHYRKALNLASLMRDIQSRGTTMDHSVLTGIREQLRLELRTLAAFEPLEGIAALEHAANNDLAFRMQCRRLGLSRLMRGVLERLNRSFGRLPR